MSCPSPQAGGASQVVVDTFAQHRTWADTYLNNLSTSIDSYLAAVRDLPDSIFAPTIGWNAPEDLGAAYLRPEVIEDFADAFQMPDGPVKITFSSIKDPTIDEDYPETPTFPSVSFEAPPDRDRVDIPTDIPGGASPTIPNAPTINLPSLEGLGVIVIPTIPEISLPEFAEPAPNVNIPGEVEIRSPEDEIPYSSAELDLLKAQISSVLGGSRGFLDIIWDQIWNRERDNEATAKQAAEEEIRELFASRGWDVPPGVETAQLIGLTQKQQDLSATAARTVAIEQNSKEVERFMAHLQQGIVLEGTLIQSAAQSADRALKGVEIFNSAAISLLQTKVTRANLELAIYESKAKVHRDKIQFEMLKLEKVQKELEIAGLAGDLDDRKIKRYLALLEGVTKEISVYLAEMDGVKTQVEVSRNVILQAAERVNVAKTQLEAQKIEQGNWLGTLEFAKTQANIFESESRNFNSRMTAITQKNSDQMRLYDAYVEQRKLDMMKLSEDVKRFEGEIRGEQIRFEASLKEREQDLEEMKALGGIERDKIAADATQFNALVAKARAEESLKLEHAKIITGNQLRLVELEVNGLEKIMTVAAQISASAMSSLDVGASIGGTDSTQYGYNFSCS